MTEDVKGTGATLRLYAEHFEQRPWDYTRKTAPLKKIVYDYPEDRLFGRKGRLVQAWGWLVKRTPSFVAMITPYNDPFRRWWFNHVSMAGHVLRRDKHIPDGALNGGDVITFWEEDGEYINLVQPSVGSLIADFLENDPENFFARAIAAEIETILARYIAEDPMPEDEQPAAEWEIEGEDFVGEVR